MHWGFYAFIVFVVFIVVRGIVKDYKNIGTHCSCHSEDEHHNHE